MRKPTKQRYHGRITVAQALGSAGAALKEAQDQMFKPQVTPLATAFQKAINSMEDSLKAMKTYKFGNKRMARRIQRLQAEVEVLRKEATALPVTVGEKAAIRLKKAKR